MQNSKSATSVLTRPSKKAGIRLRETAPSTANLNPNRRKMSVPVSETFEEIHNMNKRALHLLAKRA
jgi:hypothetical protein